MLPSLYKYKISDKISDITDTFHITIINIGNYVGRRFGWYGAEIDKFHTMDIHEVELCMHWIKLN